MDIILFIVVLSSFYILLLAYLTMPPEIERWIKNKLQSVNK